jgi:NADH:ubiquinone reductase (H+-translocating)
VAIAGAGFSGFNAPRERSRLVEGASGQVGYDWLILTVGSVNALLLIPGLADYAHGFRTVAEAMYLRDHIIRQLELASVAADPKSAPGPSNFVEAGAGYNGTEAGSVRGAWRGGVGSHLVIPP